MKKFIVASTLGILMISLGACAPPATDQELNDMCVNLVKVRGEITVPDEADLNADIEADFQKRRKHLMDWKAREMKSWDDEMKRKLEILKEEEAAGKKPAGAAKPAAEGEEEAEESESVKALRAGYAEKKKVGSKQFDEDLSALGPALKDALAGVKGMIAKKQEAYDSSVKQCIAESKAEKITQEVAQCRINAQSSDEYWNLCKTW